MDSSFKKNVPNEATASPRTVTYCSIGQEQSLFSLRFEAFLAIMYIVISLAYLDNTYLELLQMNIISLHS